MQDPFRSVYRQLNDDQKQLINDAKDQAYELMEIIIKAEKQYDVRAIRLAKTKLEETIMWLTRGISWNPDNG